MEVSASATITIETSSAVSGEVAGDGVVATEEDEDLCRICRGPSELGNPLRYPCACRGTIKYVHQECLLLWLDRRKISRCEVCKHEFSYAPVYAQNAPARLSIFEFFLGLAAKIFRFLGTLQHFGYLLFVWLLAIPLVTHWFWEFSFFKGFSEARILFMRHLTFTSILADCMHGFLLSLGMAYIYLGITFLRAIFHQDQRGVPGIGIRVRNANENGQNAGGRHGISKIRQIIRRNAVSLIEWWRVLVVRIMVCFGIVEVEQLNDLINRHAAVFPFNESAFAVITSNLVFTSFLVLLPYSLGRTASHFQSWIFSSKIAEVLLSVVITIESILLAISSKGRNALEAAMHGILYFYGVSMPEQIFEEESKAPDRDIANMAKSSNTFTGLLPAGLYGKQSNVTSLSDGTTLFIGYMVMFSFVVFYLGTILMMRYARGEPVTLRRLSGIAFRIDAVWSLVRRLITVFKKVMKMVSRNFLTILKVAILLGVKIFVFPMLCGWWLDVCALRMFGQTSADRIELSANYPVLMSLAYWMCGILYLMYVFLHVDLFQEVLHDGVFRFLPNIAEPYDFFHQIIEYPVFKHACNLLLLVGVHGSLMVLLVFLPVKIIILSVPSAFPLNLFYSEAKSVSAVILRRTLFQFGIPSTIRFYCPSKTFKFLLWKWLGVTCPVLGLSHYVVARPENNGGHVEHMMQHRVLNLFPVAIIEGSIVRSHKPGNTGRTQDERGEEGLEVDFQFAARIVILLVLACMTAIVFNSLMVAAPFLIGRTLFQAASHLYIFRGFKYDDFCSFISGSCVLRAAVSCAKFSIKYIQNRGARAFLSQIRKHCVIAFRTCSRVSLLVFVLPTCFGLVPDLLVVVPVKLPLHFALLKCWGLGWIFLFTLYLLVTVDIMHPVDQRLTVRLQGVLTNGLSHLPILRMLKEILVPTMIMLLMALCTPYMFVRLVLAILEYPLPVNSAFHRFVWPGGFAFGILWLCARVICNFVIHLHNKIRDDRYCVGRRLQDFGEGVRANLDGEDNALQLRDR